MPLQTLLKAGNMALRQAPYTSDQGEGGELHSPRAMSVCSLDTSVHDDDAEPDREREGESIQVRLRGTLLLVQLWCGHPCT